MQQAGRETTRIDASQGHWCTLLLNSDLDTYVPEIEYIYKALFYIKCHKVVHKSTQKSISPTNEIKQHQWVNKRPVCTSRLSYGIQSCLCCWLTADLCPGSFDCQMTMFEESGVTNSLMYPGCVEMTVWKSSQTYKLHTKRTRYQSDLPTLTFISCEAQILPNILNHTLNSLHCISHTE